MLEWQRNQEVYDEALKAEPLKRTACMRRGRKLIVKCKRSLGESCNEMGTMPEFFSVILCWKRYYTSEMSNTQLIVSSLMEVLAELMVCRSIIFVTTLTRTGNPCDRIFSLALTAHKLFGK